MVSVVMPAYNAAKYLGESVESVMVQTYRNWELLILDDGSSDETARIAKELEARDERIRYMKNPENLGVAATRNRGVLLAHGEWIAFLDSDDGWEPEKLERQLEAADRQQIGSRVRSFLRVLRLWMRRGRGFRIFCRSRNGSVFRSRRSRM